MPHLTVLDHAASKLQTKNFETGATYAKTKRILAVRELRFTKLHQLKRHVENLQSQPASCVVRGVLKPDAPTPLRRRRTHFDDVATTWVMLDIDNLRAPKHLRCDYTSEHAAYAITQLPDEFQGVACVWQASASAGIDPCKLKLHLWFMLDRKLTAAQLRMWLKSCNAIDPVTLRSVQPHYTAAPIGSSYKGPRVGLLKGAIKRVPVPELGEAEELSHTVELVPRAEGTADVSPALVASSMRKALLRAQEAFDKCESAYIDAHTIGAILGPAVAMECWNDREHGHDAWKASAERLAAAWGARLHALPNTSQTAEKYIERVYRGIEWGVSEERKRLSEKSQEQLQARLKATKAVREALLKRAAANAGSVAKLQEVGKELGRYLPHIGDKLVRQLQDASCLSEQQVREALAGDTTKLEAVDWQEGLVMRGKHNDEIVPCDSNLLAIFSAYPEFTAKLRVNVRTKLVEALEGNALGLSVGPVSPEAMQATLVRWFASIGCAHVGIHQALTAFKAFRSDLVHYDPFLERYPEALFDPGIAAATLSKMKPRLDTWLCKHFGAKDTEYTRLVASRSLIAAFARAVNPGAQVDTMLILHGAQGIGKTQALRSLGSIIPQGYQELQDMRDKDSVIVMNMGLVVEFSELKALRHSNEETTKAFITRQHDKLRAPYALVAEEHARRVVFIGTTNDSEFLSDHQNRRYWPVTCTSAGRLTTAQVDALWREAALRYAVGEKHYLDTEEHVELQRKQVSRYREVGAIEELLIPYLARKDKVTVPEICAALFSDTSNKQQAWNQIGKALKALEWRLIRKSDSRRRFWVRK